jgi:hypothetical protein
MENLQVSLSQRTVLVPTDVVRAVLGVDTEAVVEKVDAGELMWVFNVSAKSNIRELRFWVRELQSPECGRLSSEEAVQRILGDRRQRWCGTQIQQLLMISRPSVMRWHRAGDLPGEKVGRTFWTTRTALEQFLTSRLCHKEPETGLIGDYAPF